jgi:hypothetical protein
VKPRSHGAGWSGREAAEERGGEGRRASWVWEFRLLGGGGGAEGGDGDSIRVRGIRAPAGRYPGAWSRAVYANRHRISVREYP